MRHYAHNIGDYAAATRHLSFVEDAAYRRLLDRYYQDENPLPADLGAVARLAGARTKEERQAVANVLSEFFVLEGDGYHQKRADEEIAGFLKKVEIARENGRKSGGRPKPTDNQAGNPIGTDGKPTDKPNPTRSDQLPTQVRKKEQAPPDGGPCEEVGKPLPVAARETALGGLAHDGAPVISMQIKRMP